MKDLTLTNYSFSHRIQNEKLEILQRFSSDIPVKVGALAEALGLRVVLATMPMNISGSIQPDNDGFVIKVNRFESKERQRFTIAHEIAHFLIHNDQIQKGVYDSVLYRSNLSSRTEAEANKLAADIVMPSSAVYALTKGASPDPERIAELASEFGVSKQAMAIRVG